MGISKANIYSHKKFNQYLLILEMVSTNRIQVLDQILKEYYDTRDESGETIFEPLLFLITKTYDHQNWYLDRLRDDGYIEWYQSEWDRHVRHAGHITKDGIDFYEIGGGYVAQSAAERAKQEEEAVLRKREVEASEQSAQASVRSANSSQSSTRAAWVAGCLTFFSVVFSGLQYYDSQRKSTELIELQKQITSLDSVVKLHPKGNREIDHHQDSTIIFKKPIIKVSLKTSKKSPVAHK